MAGKGVKYWDGVDATVDGVLGGYGKVLFLLLVEQIVSPYLTHFSSSPHPTYAILAAASHKR